jgi:PAT family beta-lactamase induction signal transducer AmpG
MKPYLAENRPLRLTTLCVLYASQGMPDGFVRTALKNYLYDQNVPVKDVGAIIAMVSWPWMMKWVWGPFIDRFGYAPMGRRRPWILLAQSLMAVALAGMLLIPNLATDLRLLAAMVLLVNICSSLQDVSVDALAIDLLPPAERGAANGLMFASSYAGTFVGGKVLGHLLLTFGLTAAIGAQVGILAVILAFPLMLRERAGDALWPRPGARSPHAARVQAERPASLGQVFRLLARAFRLRSTALAAVLAVSSLITVNAHFVYWPSYVQHELGWSADAWLTLEGGWGSAFGLGGCVAGGLLASAVGAKRAVVAGLVGLSLCWFAYAGLVDLWPRAVVINVLFMAESALAGAMQVAMFALFMGICWPTVAATQFTAYTAMLNFANVLGAWQAAAIESGFGIVNSHVALGCLQLALVLVALAIDPDETRRTFAAEVGGSGEEAPRSPELDVGPPVPPEAPPHR